MSDTNKVLEIIDGMKQEIVDGVSRVVQVPSVNPKYPGVDYDEEVGGESDANKVIADFYEKIGCDMDVWAEEPGRNNVVGTIKGAGGGRSLIFNGHIDTVPTGRHEDWKFSNPFLGRVENNNIYGRGACDMKGGVVAQAMAATALHRAGVKLKGDLILESVVGEEVMDHEAGTTATIKRGYRADAAIVSEPSASGETPLAVVPVSPGLLWMSVTCSGKASHASNRAETIRAGGPGINVGVNAVDKGIQIFEALLRLEQEWGLTKKHHLFNPGHFVLHPGVIAGGPHGVQVPFIISQYATIEYAVWYHPEEDVEAVKKEIETFVHHAAQLDLWLRDNPPEIDWKLHWPPFDIPEDHPICRTIGAAHESASKGSRLEGPATTAGFYAVDDGTFLTANGIPAVTYGPGSIHHAHMVDEFVNIDEMVVATKAYALAAMDWCGVA